MVSPSAHPTVRPLVAAFTLIELLTVVAIIGILAAITFGVAKGVNERAAINQARAELSALATALEGYKRVYGDYPQTGGAGNNPAGAASNSDGPGILFNALAGKRGPRASPVSAIDGKRFLDLERFSLQSTATTDLPVSGNTTQLANAFVDPWGRRYLYFYKTSATGWQNPSYVLFSVGPDGHLEGSLPSGGVLSEEFRIRTGSGANASKGNADNIYAN
jgi:prepilin-type N-terminal cleavage/methylation domain-containing protein